MDTTSIIFERLNDLLTNNFPFRREDTVVCIDPKHIKLLNTFMSEHRPLECGCRQVHLSDATIYLPRVLGVMICSKQDFNLIKQLVLMYNIVVMPTDPSKRITYRSCSFGVSIESTEQAFPELQIIIGRNQLWKLDSVIKDLKNHMFQAKQGHLKFNESEIMWDQNTCLIKIFDVGNPKPPQLLFQ